MQKMGPLDELHLYVVSDRLSSGCGGWCFLPARCVAKYLAPCAECVALKERPARRGKRPHQKSVIHDMADKLAGAIRIPDYSYSYF